MNTLYTNRCTESARLKCDPPDCSCCVRHQCVAEAHAALTAVQWQLGQAGRAEEHFAIATAIDSRWKRVSYIHTQTRWPPKLYAAMEKFLSIVPG